MSQDLSFSKNRIATSASFPLPRGSSSPLSLALCLLRPASHAALRLGRASLLAFGSFCSLLRLGPDRWRSLHLERLRLRRLFGAGLHSLSHFCAHQHSARILPHLGEPFRLSPLESLHPLFALPLRRNPGGAHLRSHERLEIIKARLHGREDL